MEAIKRFVECLIPDTRCNLKCSYCYVIQENRRTESLSRFQYSPDHIGRALSVNRLGGVCFVSICGAGETLMPKETLLIVKCILQQGHYVNITTNGTLSKRFDELLSMNSQLLKRLHFSFSFHYLELKRMGHLDAFFDNIQKVKKYGCSYIVQFNLCDEYIPFLDEIKLLCEEKAGAAPQVAVTRNVHVLPISLLTAHSRDEYEKYGSIFDSPLFRFTLKNFMVKRREFCYAGIWSCVLNLSTGTMKKCYDSTASQNIFADLRRPIIFRSIGNNCKSPYCMNSSHFMSLGVIPSIATPSYAELRDRKQAEWMTPQVRSFLDGKLYKANPEYSSFRKIHVNLKEITLYYVREFVRRLKGLLSNV